MRPLPQQIEKPALYIVATPIGNLGDITYRAIDILSSVDFILCEDTRQTVKLLNAYGIKNELVSHHKFNEHKKLETIFSRFNKGEAAALVSDAGTPLVCDPGNVLVKSAIAAGVPVFSVPGPCSVISALTLSGFELGSFEFRGFLPKKKSAMRETIRDAANSGMASAILVSVHNLKNALLAINDICPGRQIALAKEMTKIHETVYRGTAIELMELEDFKGEFVLTLEGQALGNQTASDEQLKAEIDELAQSMTVNEALKIVAAKHGIKKNRLYDLAKLNG
ncbi:MAG: 16S rRNA (cytidine(1402)-2'-O)-methyltransferase [Eubacteriaceae bacterium]|nr:16S rRNA (cytidine(1402)-2'-O)-methyltransferase [Eubacteriaceae bacterium]